MGNKKRLEVPPCILINSTRDLPLTTGIDRQSASRSSLYIALYHKKEGVKLMPYLSNSITTGDAPSPYSLTPQGFGLGTLLGCGRAGLSLLGFIFWGNTLLCLHF